MPEKRIKFDRGTAREYPRFQVYTRAANNTEWRKEPMLDVFPSDGETIQSYERKPGAFVESCERVLIPAVGKAEIRAQFGTINGRDYEIGENWDWETRQVRIDCLLDDGETWETVWWGVCERQDDYTPPAWVTEGDDAGLPRTIKPHLIRTYICFDLFYQLSKVQYDRHYYSKTSTDTPTTSASAQSFNMGAGGLAPNMSQAQIAGASVFSHVMPGLVDSSGGASFWTDRNVLDLLLFIRQGAMTQPLKIEDPGSQLITASAWRVTDGEKISSIVERILRRSRGLGAAFIDWPTGEIGATTEPVIKVLPQLADKVKIEKIPGADNSIQLELQGADDTNTTQDLTLSGDMRIDAARFGINRSSEAFYDALETTGERIQMVVNLGVSGANDGVKEGLRQGWTDELQTAFENDAANAEQSKYAAVFRVLALDPEWQLDTIKYDNGLTFSRCDYRCRDNGEVFTPDQGEPVPGETVTYDTTPDSCRILQYLPCPINVDLQTGEVVEESSPSSQMQQTAFFERDGDSYTKIDPGQSTYRCSHYAVNLTTRAVEGVNRQFADTFESLRFLVGLELPHRVRLYTQTDDKKPPRRVMRLQMPGAHLWIGHRGTVVGEVGGEQQRIADDKPAIYRDDRNLIQRKHAFAAKWYLTDRKEGGWTYRKTCALVSKFTDEEGAQEYPKLGHVIKTLVYGGTQQAINSVVSSVSYNRGDTAVRIDWQGLA